MVAAAADQQHQGQTETVLAVTVLQWGALPEPGSCRVRSLQAGHHDSRLVCDVLVVSKKDWSGQCELLSHLQVQVATARIGCRRPLMIGSSWSGLCSLRSSCGA
jgi:hypothetical protein